MGLRGENDSVVGDPGAAGQGAPMLSVGVGSLALLSTLSSLQLLLQGHALHLKPLELNLSFLACSPQWVEGASCLELPRNVPTMRLIS